MWEMIFWAILTVALIIAEITTVQLVSIWFAAGGIVAFVLSFFNVSFPVQLIVFVIVAVALLIATRPLAKKLNAKRIKTNVEAVVGKECIVKEKIDNINGKGRVLLEGIDWAAKNAVNDDTIEPEAICVIEEVRGVTLFIRQIS